MTNPMPTGRVHITFTKYDKVHNLSWQMSNRGNNLTQRVLYAEGSQSPSERKKNQAIEDLTPLQFPL